MFIKRSKLFGVLKISGSASLAVVACLVLACASPTAAQGVGSSRGLSNGDGIHMIQGRILFPSGAALGSRSVKVRLESVSAFGELSTVTDEDGSFHFRNLQAGGYTVVVEAGKEYEPARETVNIDREASPGGRTIQVSIQLRLKVDASNPAFAGVPQGALDLYQKGDAAAKKGSTKSSIESFSKAISIYPNFPLALNELSLQYMKLAQEEKTPAAWEKAKDTLEQLLKLKPNDPVGQLNLGIVLYNLKKLDEAEVHLRETLKLGNPSPTAHYYLGLTLISVKNYGEAEKELELTISNGGDNLALAHKFLGGLYMGSKNPKAADELEKYLKLEPKAADAERIKATIKDLRSKQP
jgi:Flp pilus assembly protein TadD